MKVRGVSFLLMGYFRRGCGGARGRMVEWREECPERSKCRIVVNVEN
jgi:hypothetical protein